MILYASLAVLNGMIIGTSRAINGRLSAERGALDASLWNHIGGFALLTLILAAAGGAKVGVASGAPAVAYLGGLFGALFVAVNSYVFPRVGALNAAMLVIGGQMATAVLLDARNHGTLPSAARCAGAALVLFGVFMSREAAKRRQGEAR